MTRGRFDSNSTKIKKKSNFFISSSLKQISAKFTIFANLIQVNLLANSAFHLIPLKLVCHVNHNSVLYRSDLPNSTRKVPSIKQHSNLLTQKATIIMLLPTETDKLWGHCYRSLQSVIHIYSLGKWSDLVPFFQWLSYIVFWSLNHGRWSWELGDRTLWKLVKINCLLLSTNHTFETVLFFSFGRLWKISS